MDANLLPAVPTTTELERMRSSDCAEYLDSLVRADFDLLRLRVGAVLWKWRSLTPDNEAFGLLIAPYAAKFDVTVDTLRRWRVAAEERLDLPKAIDRPSPPPSHSQRGDGTPRRPRPAPKVTDVTSKAKPAASSDLPKQEPALPQQMTLDFEAASYDDLVGLGKARLLAVQKKISEALRVAR